MVAKQVVLAIVPPDPDRGILVLRHQLFRQGDRLDSGRHVRVLARQTDMRRGGRVVEGARLESV